MAEINVLMVTETFPPNCGGGGWSTYHLANTLNKTDEVNVKVLTVNQNEVKDDGLEVEIISITRFPNELAYYQIYKQIQKRKDNYDIIQGQHSLTIPPLGLIDDKPTVGVIRDYWPVCYRTTLRDRWGNNHLQCGAKCLASTALDWNLLFPYKVFNHKLRKHLTKKVDLLAARSQFVEERLKEHGFDHTEVMYNFVPEGFTDEVTPKGEEDIIYVGKLEEQKGPQLLLEAISKILEKQPCQRFVFLGEGKLREQLENRAKELDVRENIEFKGHVPIDEVKGRMKGAKAVVSPSLWHEPLSRVIIEAKSLETPVITTRRGGNSEMTGTENPVASEKELKEAILNLEEDGSSKQIPSSQKIAEKWIKTYIGLRND